MHGVNKKQHLKRWLWLWSIECKTNTNIIYPVAKNGVKKYIIICNELRTAKTA